MTTSIEQLLTHLDRVARSTAAGIDPGEAADGGAALLFTGRSHVMVPDLLLRQVEQRQLDPDAAVTWQMLRRSVTGATPAFHRLYAFVRQQIHCSKPKAGTVIALLRVTRWLTIRDVRNHRGHRLPFVALLHESPLKLEETLLIDPHFRAFVVRVRDHRHRMIAGAAQALSEQLARLADGSGNQPAAPRVKKVDRGPTQNQPIALWEAPRSNLFDSGEAAENQPVTPQIKNVDSGPAERSSCSNTTTTTDPEEIHFPAHPRVRELLPSAREVIGRSGLSRAVAQEVVFEWVGALITPDSRVERPIPYLCSLLRAAEKGEFVFTDLGMGESRKAREPLPPSVPGARRPAHFPAEKEPPPDWPDCLAHARAQVTEQEYVTWLAPLSAVDGDDGVWVYAPNPIVAERVRDDYLPLFQAFYAARPGGVTVSQEIFR